VPRYDYKCTACGIVQERWHAIWECDLEHECACGGLQERLISAPSVNPDLEPYLDENLGHQPVWIESRQHRTAEMKRRGLVDQWGVGARLCDDRG